MTTAIPLIGPGFGAQQTPAPQTAAVCAIPGVANQYFVESEDKKTACRVFWDGARGECTCASFPRSGNCAHINAVKNRPPGTAGKKDVDGILTQRFSDSQLADDQQGNTSVVYEEVVKRLNEAFGVMYWSFSHEEPVDCGDSFTCAGRLEAVIGDIRAWKENTGYCQYVDGGQADGMAGARTGAVRDALVKCALLFSVGLEQLNRPPMNTERQAGGFGRTFEQRPF